MGIGIGLGLGAFSGSQGVTAPFDYGQYIVNTYSPTALWRLNETSGTTAVDSSGNGHDGTYAGVTLNDVIGPDGINGVPFWDASGDYVRIGTAGLGAAFNGSEFDLAIWAKATDSAVLADSNFHMLFSLLADGGNFIRIVKLNVPNFIRWEYQGGSVQAKVDHNSFTDTGWNLFGLSIDRADNYMKAYLNGVHYGTLILGPPTWGGGSINTTQSNIGTLRYTDGLWPWGGWLGYAMLFPAGTLGIDGHADLYARANPPL